MQTPTRRRATSEMVIRVILAAFFLIAAIAKVIDPDAFGVVVWRLLGRGVTPGVAVTLGSVLAAAELSLALLIVLDRATRAWLLAALVLTGLFCLALVRLMMMSDPPGCGCLSVPLPGGSRIELAAGIGRNVALVWLTLIALYRPTPPTRVAPDSRRAGGFSLLETLVVIAVIALILSITIPSLAQIRWSSKAHERALGERQVFSALMLYMDDHDESFPYFGTRGEPYGDVVIKGHVFSGGDYFSPQRWFWASVLVPSYIADRREIEAPERGESLIAQGRAELVAAHAQLTSTAVVDPAYLAPDAPDRPFNRAHFRGTRHAEIAYPSDKAVLVSYYGGPGGESSLVGVRGGYPVVFADGSTKLFREHEINTMPTIERPILGEIPIHGTLGGLAGRDVLPTGTP
ncbi:MAG: type II secretion system protein [Phycisphaerales bacterium]